MLAASSSEHYPYVGVDLADETFEAHGFDVAQVMEGLGSRLIRLAESQLPLRAMLFLRRLPACSLPVEMGPRACEIMQIACARSVNFVDFAAAVASVRFGVRASLQELFESLGARSTGS